MSDGIHFFNAEARVPEWACGAGEKWVLVAPTGWGKSQWLRQLTLLRDAAFTSLEWKGQLVDAANARAYRRQWIFLAQTSYRSTESVETHLREVAGLVGETDSEAFIASFREALGELGFGGLDVNRRTLQELSGGELQIVSLARTVCLRPEGIFLDEPTSAMDGVLRQKAEIWFLKNFAGAFLWVSHDGDQVTRLRAAGARLVPL